VLYKPVPTFDEAATGDFSGDALRPQRGRSSRSRQEIHHLSCTAGQQLIECDHNTDIRLK
jgi:hypothetical protein